jgi:hypothetical protein
VEASQWLTEAQHLIGRHLDSLRESLIVLGERLREAVAHSCGGSAAGVVKEVVRRLLASNESAPAYSSSRSLRTWASDYDSDQNPYGDDDRAWGSEWSDRDPDDLRSGPTSPPIIAPTPLRWSQALAVAFQTIAWWLRRKASETPTWATWAIGVIVAIAAYWCGAAMSGTVMKLLALAEVPTSTTSSRSWSSYR